MCAHSRFTIKRSYAWGPWNGRIAVYAADPRALARLSRHPRRLARFGIRRPRAAARQIRRAAKELTARAALCRRKLGIAFEPVMVVLTPTGEIEETWINCRDTWRELRAQLAQPDLGALPAPVEGGE